MPFICQPKHRAINRVHLGCVLCLSEICKVLLHLAFKAQSLVPLYWNSFQGSQGHWRFGILFTSKNSKHASWLQPLNSVPCGSQHSLLPMFQCANQGFWHLSFVTGGDRRYSVFRCGYIMKSSLWRDWIFQLCCTCCGIKLQTSSIKLQSRWWLVKCLYFAWQLVIYCLQCLASIN